MNVDLILLALYLVYAVLYCLAVTEVLDWGAVVFGCLSAHFAGLAFHVGVIWQRRRSGVVRFEWVADYVYPDYGPATWWAYFVVDVAQLAAWGVAATEVATGDVPFKPWGVACLVAGYFGVVGCIGKIILTY